MNRMFLALSMVLATSTAAWSHPDVSGRYLEIDKKVQGWGPFQKTYWRYYFSDYWKDSDCSMAMLGWFNSQAEVDKEIEDFKTQPSLSMCGGTSDGKIHHYTHEEALAAETRQQIIWLDGKIIWKKEAKK